MVAEQMIQLSSVRRDQYFKINELIDFPPIHETKQNNYTNTILQSNILSRRRKSNHVIIGKKSCEQSIALNRDIIIYIDLFIHSFIHSIAQRGISSIYNPFRKHKENNIPLFLSFVRTYVRTSLIEIGIALNRCHYSI